MARSALQSRATDTRPLSAHERPSILGRAIQRAMIFTAVGFIIYGTTGPLSSAGVPGIQRLDAWRWIPPIRDTDANDVVTNLFVYIPVGLALRFLARRRGRRPIVDFALAAGAATALSWATECLQQWIPGRTASLTDVALNALGGVVGALLAPSTLRGLRELHARAYLTAQVNRSRVLALIVLSAIGIAMTAPWTISPFAVDLSLFHPADMADFERFAFFAIWGSFLGGSLTPVRYVRLASTILQIILVAAVTEAAQTVLALHTASLRDLIMQALGGMLGLGIASAISARHAAGLAKLATGLAIVSLAAASCLLIATGPPLALREPAIDWMPFHAEFSVRFTIAVADIVRTTLLLGVLALLGFEWAGRGAGLVIALALTSGTAMVELARATLSDHVATSTPLVLAGIAAAIAARVWTSVLPRGANIAPAAGERRSSEACSSVTSAQPI